MSTATTAFTWTVTFEDDFEGSCGSEPSPLLWARDLGGSGFGNNELQCYTDGSANAFLDGAGNLVIEARSETISGHDGVLCAYSSARLQTKGRFSQRYGKFEARMKLPRGQGIWPAFWLLGESFDTVGWPECGEIDIMESIGPVAKTLYGSLHGPGYCGANNLHGILTLDEPLSDAFHVYGVDWSTDQISWTFDGSCYATVTRHDVGNHSWQFDGPFYILLNLAVGGDWPGCPDSTTSFPQRLIVDYVRVWGNDSKATSSVQSTP
jgi:beta-glucanase (GH16 family)